MNNEAKKLHLDKIDVYFGELKTNKDSANTLKNIENELNSIFNQDFTVRTYKSKPSESAKYISSILPPNLGSTSKLKGGTENTL